MRFEGGEYEGGGGGDLLEVLRQAREAKELLRDEMGESKGSWLRDLAEIAKVLPQLLGSLPQIQQFAAQQQQGQRVVTKYIPRPAPGQIVEGQAQNQLPKFELSMEDLVPLSEFQAGDAWRMLHEANEMGWITYLSQTSLEQMESALAQLAIDCEEEEQTKAVNVFLEQKHHWLAELVDIAHSTGQNTG
jgi:hypothetical protein